MKVLALDGMGVIYSVGEDVLDLLCPFIIEKGGIRDIDEIQNLYYSASLGHISASKFWKLVGIAPDLEDDYLERHKLTDGLIDFLEAMKSRDIEVWGLFNDVSEWSIKLRRKFGLDKYFRGFIVSGDIGIRKPDSLIYQYLLRQLNASPSNVTFVDDRLRNLDSAASLGFDTVLFDPNGGNLPDEKRRSVASFSGLLPILADGQNNT